MELNLTTPALLFPAISLLLLAYTNRFQVLALLVRQLRDRERTMHDDITVRQMTLIDRRIHYIKYMQALGIISFLLCTFCMLGLFLDQRLLGVVFFGASLLALMLSLVFALIEVMSSTSALHLELQDICGDRADTSAHE